MLWIFILAYLSVQLVAGLWISRRIRSEKDFFIAGRNLPLPVVAVSLYATWFGAETCIGSAGAVYAVGLSGSRADPFGYALSLFLMGGLLAARMWTGGYVTLGDFFKERFGRWAEKLVVWIILPSSIIWGAAQVRALGQVVSATTDIDVNHAIALATVFVVGYTFLGGLLGDVINDVIQGIIICVGLGCLLYFSLDKVGDVGALFRNMDPARLSFVSSDGTLWQQMDRAMVPVLGSLVAQELLSRVFSAKSASVARRASFVACGLYLLLGSIPVLLGLLGPSLVSGLDHHEDYLIVMAKSFLPPAVFVVFAGALIAAILSTIDSILLGVSALLSHNFLVPAFKIEKESAKVLCARLVVGASGLICYVLAVSAESIYELLEEASSFGTAGVLVATLGGALLRFGEGRSACAALCCGLLATPLCRFVFDLQAPFLASIALSATAYAVFAVPAWAASPVAAGKAASYGK